VGTKIDNEGVIFFVTASVVLGEVSAGPGMATA
jgi:hypothetical protein